MTTLINSARTEHLTAHTVVAHVIGAAVALSLAQQMRSAGWDSTVAVLSSPTGATVFRDGHTDPDGAPDLPNHRVLCAAATGLFSGAYLGALVGAATSDAGLATITGGFGAVLGSIVGALSSGLGNHAGERASSQSSAPGRTIGLVTTRTADEAGAAEAAWLMAVASAHDIRIGSANGFWRAQSTF